MRQWTPSHHSSSVQALEGLIDLMGEAAFEHELLAHLHPVMPAASYSIYQVGPGCAPQLFMSASLGVPDTTRACWQAYLSGPYLTDRSLMSSESAAQNVGGTVLRHITANEVSAEHRARVYEAHGVAERVSVVQQEQASVFAINFYRHAHQAPFRDVHLAEFDALATALIALVKKQLRLKPPSELPRESLCEPLSQARSQADWAHWVPKLQQLDARLSPREVAVCARLLTGMTQDGIASDLSLSVPTVKTYRNRAFERLGIHFRNELYALMYARKG